MSERIAVLKARLAVARERLNRALDAISERAEEQIYSEGAQWTVRQLAIHLMLADTGHNRMVSHYAEGKDFIPADYDIERYNKRSVDKQSHMSLSEIRAALAASRAEFLAWLDSQTDDAFLDKTGRHANLKILSIEQIIGVMASHEEGHSADMEALLSKS